MSHRGCGGLFFRGQMQTLEGYVDHIIYRNEDNGYTVFVLATDGMKVPCVGNFGAMSDGENLALDGDYTEHQVYGKQFKVTEARQIAPKDAVAMERYLGSGVVKGIGVALASRIVRRFGDDTFRIIDEEPERLAEIKGISMNKAREISAQMCEMKELRDAMVYIQGFGITPGMAVRIYNRYHSEIYSILENNPYRLAEDIDGIGFKTADEIAQRSGISVDSDFRIRSGIVYTLQLAAGEGHVYLPEDELTERCAALLGVEPEDVRPHYMNLAVEKKLQINEDAIYLSSSWHCEKRCAEYLCALDMEYDIEDERLNKQLGNIEKKENLVLDDIQRKAVKEAARHGVFVLTGGPGTGKTTTIRALISYFKMEGLDIFLAAPTGRAAKRMSETTGYAARTIHRMLEVKGGAEDGRAGVFERNELNPLETDVVIIDEMSMVDVYLFLALLKAIGGGTRLILVGDADQLPSVGPGNVLKDILESDVFSSVRLSKIFRQAGESDIVNNAHKIRRDEPVEIDNKNSKDFFLLPRDNADVIIAVMLNLIQNKLPSYVDAEPFDIQVLTPMKKGLVGVERLNQVLQSRLNPPMEGKKEKEFGERLFREGDKVMQIKNNYDMEWEVPGRYGIPADRGVGIFNGDLGIIKEISEFTSSMTIVFDDDHEVDYPFKNIDELELAYAVTIHKSQGSEYPAVIVPLMPGPRMLMNKNLIYTAITRAKSCVTLVGEPSVFNEMCENRTQQQRYSGLADRLKETMEVIG